MKVKKASKKKKSCPNVVCADGSITCTSNGLGGARIEIDTDAGLLACEFNKSSLLGLAHGLLGLKVVREMIYTKLSLQLKEY